MGLRFYNTLSRAKEEFAPAGSTTARVYSCGPTVYSRQHIGNMRAAVFVDVLKRALRYDGYDVEDVVNITDVGHLASDEDEGEDKVARAARESGTDPADVARHFEELYWDDLKRLNIVPPQYRPRATEHIREQVDFIRALEARGLTYATDDGVYFDTEKLPRYGELSRQPLEGKEAGARVAVRGGKHNPRDFALWKFLVGEHAAHAMRWESPWGAGFPGWHIECSAMGRRYLGETIDIHTGGIEHIPIHHENEIAQNEGSGLLTVRFWVHNEHLLLEGGKMSKSLGNILSLDDLAARGVSPLSFRYWLLTAHYRSPVNFTWAAVTGAQHALSRLSQYAVSARGGSDPPREEGQTLLG
ncbi:MAG: cysteine--tRNA ligase, partial [Patescibacteria group bacterium]|nr:cysteine--tRNA ligase [Patescibacteria group bacterium]